MMHQKDESKFAKKILKDKEKRCTVQTASPQAFCGSLTTMHKRFPAHLQYQKNEDG